MKSLKLFVAALAVTVTSSNFYAQASTVTLEQKATQQTEQMATDLELNAYQKEQIQSINLGIMQKNDAIRTDASMTPELKTESVKQNNAARIDMINALLTPEQSAKFNNKNTMQLDHRKQLNIQNVEPRKKN
jgi:Spy/CpxP family protein refolding chaperone